MNFEKTWALCCYGLAVLMRLMLAICFLMWVQVYFITLSHRK